MSTPPGNRRKRERQACSLYIQFMDNRTGELVGDLADISREGFMLESVKPIPLNADFSFGITLPPEISRKPFIVFTARSRWSLPDRIDTRLYNTGFQILKMDPGDTQAIELLIERYGSGRAGKGSGNDYLWKS
jgi:PilZ domain